MRRGHRNILLFGGLAVAGYLITSSFASSISSPPSTGNGTSSLVDPDQTAGIPADPTTAPGTPADLETPQAVEPETESTRSYAIALHELPGLPPDAESGVRLEIWATWKPPMTKQREVQKLVVGGSLERIAPPITPEGPPVAILSVPEKELDDLLFGDRFADLSAAVVP